MRPQRLLIGIFTIIICICLKRTSGVEIANSCNNKNNCHECIRSLNCAWCMKPNYTEDRCFQYSLGSQCPQDSIFYPQTSKVWESNRPLTSERSSKRNVKGAKGGGNNSEEIIQLKPQRISLKLRANEDFPVLLQYSRAADYPIDLYYLMDLSYSMIDDKEKLSILGDRLAKKMSSITSDFRLGFGSFIDKVRMPFTKVASGVNSYSYRNVMPLGKDANRFASEVKKAVISGNYDTPEGGLDALVQAIVCTKEIGWREKARRLLVFSTDAQFHSAGDGKLAGLIEPNDLKCHLDAQGNYTHAEILDYPSTGAVGRIVKDNLINVIFAVTQNVSPQYKLLSKHIEGSSCATLSEDSSNVVKLVHEQYQQISSTIQMRDNSTQAVDISYYSDCGRNGTQKLTSKCDKVHIGDEIVFTTNIRFNSCPPDRRDWRQVIKISPVGINESLTIDLEMLCGCECELEKDTISTHCSKNGDLVCGVCDCDDTHVGAQCECLKTDDNNIDDDSCHENSTLAVCSGRGICSCGVCQCDKRSNPEEIISGKYCQCENFSCERHDRRICSGPEHGLCECGKCACKPGWTGTACECQVSTDSCRSPDGGELCSAKGTCECGVCNCKNTAQGRYSGQYCELCPTCSSRCDELKDCVQCQMYKTGKLKEFKDCGGNCTSVTALDKEDFEKYELTKGEKKCVFYDEDDCKFGYIFKEIGDEIGEVRAQTERECLAKVAMFRILGGVIGAVVGIGLSTLLLWKLITKIQDNREYKRFEKEQLKANWDTGNNPLYRQATSNFKNPTYNG